MKQRDFIAKHAQHMREGTQCDGTRFCSSVFCDGSTIYSYGRHYPLLYPITSEKGDILLVVNATGYSNTTAKHISYASMQSDIAVRSTSVAQNATDIMAQLAHEHMTDMNTYSAMKRKDTKKAARFVEGINRLNSYMDKIKGI